MSKLKRTLAVFLLLLCSSNFPGCAPAPLSPVDESEVLLQTVRRLFLSQGVEYNANALSDGLNGLYSKLKQLRSRAAGGVELDQLDRQLARMECFMGLLAAAAYQGAFRPAPPPASADAPPPTARSIPRHLLAHHPYFPQSGSLVSVQTILQFYGALQWRVPDYSFAYSAPASFLLLYGDWDEAARLADKALSLDPDDFLALRTRLVTLHIRKEDPAARDRLADRFKKVVGAGYAVDFFLSRISKQAGDLDEAIFYAEKAMARIRDVRLTLYIAQLEEQAGQLEKARYHYGLLTNMSQFMDRAFYESMEREVRRLARRVEEKKRGNSS